MNMPKDPITLGALTVIFIVVLFQVILPERPLPPPEPSAPALSTTPCRGEPIAVNFAFTGTIHEDWTCKIQCTDRKLRYILYSNGIATQCEELPGCNDYGEDHNITCAPPLKTNNLPKS